LSVDAGRIPPGTMAFFRKNADLGVLRARAVLSSAFGIAGVVLACAGGPRLLALLLLVAAALTAVLSTPTVAEDDGEGAAARKQVLIVTPRGLIGRDHSGLRSWRFEELANVFTGGHAGRPHLVLVERSGARHTIDHLRFADGERLLEVIDSRLRGAVG